MQELWLNLQAWTLALVASEALGVWLRAVLLVLGGILLARAARFTVRRGFARTLSAQQRVMLERALTYTILTLFVVSALRQLGFNLGVLIGAAGIVTVAIGFASQTSASNLISGLFLTLENAVAVGDVIRVEGVTGEVLSVDLLSTKVRTFDNLLVRIPNETMVKTQITNLNRFPIRRVDLQIGVAYKQDLEQVQRVLFEVADRNPLSLEEPAPLLIAQGFGESSVDYQFSVWAKSENFLELRNGMQHQIKDAFDANGIEIPFPHRTIYTGSVTEPLPVRLVEEAGK
ncbi:MAG: mechanosensitive ion channel family protein [Trueperaceae bacterium]